MDVASDYFVFASMMHYLQTLLKHTSNSETAQGGRKVGSICSRHYERQEPSGNENSRTVFRPSLGVASDRRVASNPVPLGTPTEFVLTRNCGCVSNRCGSQPPGCGDPLPLGTRAYLCLPYTSQAATRDTARHSNGHVSVSRVRHREDRSRRRRKSEPVRVRFSALRWGRLRADGLLRQPGVARHSSRAASTLNSTGFDRIYWVATGKTYGCLGNSVLTFFAFVLN